MAVMKLICLKFPLANLNFKFRKMELIFKVNARVLVD